MARFCILLFRVPLLYIAVGGALICYQYFINNSNCQTIDSLEEQQSFLRYSLMLKDEKMIHFKKQVHDEILRTVLLEFNKIFRMIVLEELSKYDADKTGMPDFALENLGGCVVSTDTELDEDPKSLFQNILGRTKSLNTIIQPNVQPGDCYPFKGSTGSFLIQLACEVTITGVSLEHLPIALSPTRKVTSAPKEFSVWGLSDAKDLDNGCYLGNFTYDGTGRPLQYYEILEPRMPFNFIQLKIHSNYGHRYTCIYRFRVHGVTDCNP